MAGDVNVTSASFFAIFVAVCAKLTMLFHAAAGPQQALAHAPRGQTEVNGKY